MNQLYKNNHPEVGKPICIDCKERTVRRPDSELCRICWEVRVLNANKVAAQLDKAVSK